MAKRESARRIRDRDDRDEVERDDEPKSLVEVLELFLRVKGIESAVVVGRDGFVIEEAGSDQSDLVEMDTLGASLATMVDAMESMGADLDVSRFGDMYIRYGRAVIIGIGVGDAVLALTSPDDKSLGIIRYNTRKLLPMLEQFV